MASKSKKTTTEAKIKRLRKRLKKARKKVTALKAEMTSSALGATVSPLAPEGGFPSLPEIGGVTFATAEAGVKYKGRRDVMMARVAAGATVAGVFTKSSTRSAPVRDCQAKIAAYGPDDMNAGYAILVNSGNSNAFTGSVGDQAVAVTVDAVAASLGIPSSHVLTASTGVIGEPLPAEKITAVVDQLRDTQSSDSAALAAQAIMTTDTFPKGASAEVSIDGNPVRIAGFAKGSGMIAPDMATMLVFIFTDAKIAQRDLQAALANRNSGTFNAITVDSDTSTSDSLILVATGASGVEIGGPRSASNAAFSEALGQVMLKLAHLVVKDGEGATKFVEVNISGAASDGDARKVAMAIANSPLVKTAIAGEDPNWGRVVMAVGKSGARAERDLLTIRFGDILVAEGGWVSPTYSEEAGAAYMRQQELAISVDLGLGSGKSRVWTCDFTKRYIEINADYRS